MQWCSWITLMLPTARQSCQTPVSPCQLRNPKSENSCKSEDLRDLRCSLLRLRKFKRAPKDRLATAPILKPVTSLLYLNQLRVFTAMLRYHVPLTVVAAQTRACARDLCVFA